MESDIIKQDDRKKYQNKKYSLKKISAAENLTKE